MAVTIAEGTVTQGFHLFTYKTGTATVAATLADKIYIDAAKVSNGANVKYIGLPTGATFTVTETNDVAGTTYSSEVKVDGTTNNTNTNMYTDGTLAMTGATTVTADTAHTVGYTNTLLLISPTGVALRVAPYALILAAGVVLLVLSKKRRTAED